MFNEENDQGRGLKPPKSEWVLRYVRINQILR